MHLIRWAVCSTIVYRVCKKSGRPEQQFSCMSSYRCASAVASLNVKSPSPVTKTCGCGPAASLTVASDPNGKAAAMTTPWSRPGTTVAHTELPNRCSGKTSCGGQCCASNEIGPKWRLIGFAVLFAFSSLTVGVTGSGAVESSTTAPLSAGDFANVVARVKPAVIAATVKLQDGRSRPTPVDHEPRTDEKG